VVVKKDRKRVCSAIVAGADAIDVIDTATLTRVRDSRGPGRPDT